MDVAQYYITTLTTAATKIGPIVGFLVLGYLIFVKLPFWFFLRNMNIQKKEFEQKLPQDFQKDYSLENYKDFQRRMKLMAPPKKEEAKKEAPKTERKEEKKKEEPKKEFKQETKKEAPKRPAPQSQPKSQSPEEVFKLRPGEKLSKEELRKKYHELLKQNHPDRVASLGEDFKKLAENNTKEINKAYDKLKSKAA